MRAAAAALPEPCSATTSTGTSFCDSSRITASTVRMPELTLSSQTREPPFCGATAVARISVLSRSILIRFTILRPRQWGDVSDKGLYLTRAHALPIRRRGIKSHRNNIRFFINDLRLSSVVATEPIRYHIADKWEIYYPHPRYSVGITFHLSWG